MMFWRRRRAPAQKLYESVLAQARSPGLFGPGRTPDTVDGRFEMLAFHLALLVRRMQADGQGGKDAAQHVFDAFVADMDVNLRELGASDTRFGKKMRQIVEAFYGRAKAYGDALEADGDDMLRDVIARNLVEDGASAEWLNDMVAYCRASAEKLAAASLEDLLGGADLFPAPPGS